MLLALDTSTDVVTVALHDGSRVIAHDRGSGARRHAEVLAPLVAGVLAEVDISAGDVRRLAVGVGPGAYTGLRVGIVTAQTLALAWSIPVTGACSLDALAVQAHHEQPRRVAGGLLVVTDARRGQVYWARYTEHARRVAGPAVASADAVPARGLPAFGSGALEHRRVFDEVHEPAVPDAAWLARGLCDGVIAEAPPHAVYLREPDVTVAAAAKSVLQRGSPP